MQSFLFPLCHSTNRSFLLVTLSPKYPLPLFISLKFISLCLSLTALLPQNISVSFSLLLWSETSSTQAEQKPIGWKILSNLMTSTFFIVPKMAKCIQNTGISQTKQQIQCYSKPQLETKLVTIKCEITNTRFNEVRIPRTPKHASKRLAETCLHWSSLQNPNRKTICNVNPV